MQRRLFLSRWLGVVALCCLLAASCNSGSTGAAEPGAGDGLGCDQLAAEAANQLEALLEDIGDLTIQELIGSPPDDLADFQRQVTADVVEAELKGSCLARDRDQAFETALLQVDSQTITTDLVLESLVNSQRRSVRDVEISPGDDLVGVLNRLAGGSSLTLSGGTYELSERLLIPVGVTINGAGQDATILRSSAPDAAVVVFDQGSLVLKDLTVRSVGDGPISVLEVFGRDLDLRRVRIAGASPSADGESGNGIVLRSAAERGPDGVLIPALESEPAQVSVVDSVVEDNGAAGVIALGTASVKVQNSLIAGNVSCGLCFNEEAVATVIESRVAGNGAGIQAGDGATVTVDASEVSLNTTVGVGVEGKATVTVDNSLIDRNDGGLQAIEQASVSLTNSELLDNLVGLAGSDEASVAVEGNSFIGGLVHVQAIGPLRLSAINNTFAASSEAALLFGGEAEIIIHRVTVEITGGDAVIVGGQADVHMSSIRVDGGRSGIVFAGAATGVVQQSVLDGQGVAIAIGGEAAPSLKELTVDNATNAGVVFSEQGQGQLMDSTFTDAGEIGVQVGDTASPTVTNNSFVGTGVGVGLSMLGQATATFEDNTVRDFEVGVDVTGDASPRLVGNEVIDAVRVGMSFAGNSLATVEGNAIFNPGAIGIQISSRAMPTVTGNVVGADPDLVARTSAGPGDDSADAGDESEARPSTVGVLYAGEAAGTASTNQVFSFIVGIQVGERAAPLVVDNEIDGGGLDGIGMLYLAAGGGRAEANTTSDHSIGFQLGGESAPVIVDNVVSDALQAAFVVGEGVAAELTGNRCPTNTLGIVLTNGAAPTLGENDCVTARP